MSEEVRRQYLLNAEKTLRSPTVKFILVYKQIIGFAIFFYESGQVFVNSLIDIEEMNYSRYLRHKKGVSGNSWGAL